MASFAELIPILDEVQSKTREGAGAFVEARNYAIDAIHILNSVNTGGDTLKDPISEFEKVVEGIGGLLEQLVSIPDMLNPYLINNGLPPFDPVDASVEEYVAPTPPPTEEPAPPKAEPEPAAAPESPTTESTPTTESQPMAEAQPPKAEPQFKGIAEDLQAQVEQMQDSEEADPTTIEGHIGGGTEQYVFETADGTKVVKVSSYKEGNPHLSLDDVKERQADRITAMERVKGREGFEQLDEVIEVGPNKPAVMVYDKAPGETLRSMSPEARDNIPPEHMDKLVANVAYASTNGIYLDTFGADENVLYDSDKGYTLIDFSLAGPQTKPPDPAASVRTFAREVLFDHPTANKMPLPAEMKTFYKSYKGAFGKEEAEKLKGDWESRHRLPEDL